MKNNTEEKLTELDILMGKITENDIKLKKNMESMSENTIKKKIIIPMINEKLYKNITYNQIRRHKIIDFMFVMSKHDIFKKLDDKTKNKISEDIEKSCYNATIDKSDEYNIIKSWDNGKFLNMYHTKCYNIISTLDVDNDVSKNIIKNMINKKFPLNKIGYMEYQDFCPEVKEKLLKEKIEKEKNKSEKKYSKFYKCRNCGEKKCTVHNEIRRSLDEGVCQYIICISCGTKRNV